MDRVLKRKAKGERPYFFEDPNVDKLVSMIMGLAGETSVLMDRVDTIEQLLEKKGLLKISEIEGYEPSTQVLESRANRREIYLSEILRIKGALNEAIVCSEKIMELRPWSIIGTYSFNYRMKSN